jgi:PIN domain nuclease of toxin-antitoxin system
MVLDTCSLLWRCFEPEKISQATLNDLNKTNEIIVCSISFWEIGIKIKKKKLSLPIKLVEFSKLLRQVENIQIISIDLDIWIKALDLNWKHKDPVDRVIVAAATKYNCPIVTSDKSIKRFYKNVLI